MRVSPQHAAKTKGRRVIVAVALACAFVIALGVSIWQLALQTPGEQADKLTAEQTEGTSSGVTSSLSKPTAADSASSDDESSAATAAGADTEEANAGASGSNKPEAPQANASTDGSGSTQGKSNDSSPASPAGPSDSSAPESGSNSDSNENAAPSTAPQEPAAPAAITVSLSIDCLNAVNYGDALAQSLSSSGYLLSTQLTLGQGATVYDTLKASGAPINASSGAMGVYVIGLYSLAEKACGPTSGWIYLVNGSRPSKSCDAYVLSDGDSIQWRYTVKSGDT
jgi:cytoskeletal protein RodZ